MRDLDGYIASQFEVARNERGISVTELARRIGIDKKRLWYALNRQRIMHVDKFVKLCAFFDFGLGRFIDRQTVEELRSPEPFRGE